MSNPHKNNKWYLGTPKGGSNSHIINPSDWILADGFWNDEGKWVDEVEWKDDNK